MINFKKIDEKDVVFINKAISAEDEKAFSDFLKNRKRSTFPGRKKRKTKVPG
jgi:hypothetical protein